ncbi:MAG: glutamate-5-semialdehyde dehydrogenase [Acidimicrobiia bacterium]|nr:glutamate-5-semialdehyde dehydrogenase [Acidimicrobiia bacterium]
MYTGAVPQDQARSAREAQRAFVVEGADMRTEVLRNLERLLGEREDDLLAANQRDLEAPGADDLPGPIRKRLVLSPSKLETLREGVNVLIDSTDPVGRPMIRRELDDGLVLEQVRVPIGVLLIVFESRPDAVIQIGSLALRTGNAVLMKGGSEALHSNRALTDLLREAVVKAGGPADVVQNVEGREAVADLLAMDEHIDLVVPRGSADLVRAIKAASRIPVLGHADGICHVYVDEAADPGMAVRVAVDSKTNYVAVCNAAETLLLHRDFPASQAVVRALLDAGVDVRGDEAVAAMASGVTAARPSDFGHEFGDLTIAARVVDGVDEAIDHIHAYGSAHTDTVVTEDAEVARRFLDTVDSSSVFWNASTRFADGFRYGLGAEVGIATGRVHARGPMGAEGLFTTKWLLRGDGHVVGDYGPGKRSYTHRDLALG